MDPSSDAVSRKEKRIIIMGFTIVDVLHDTTMFVKDVLSCAKFLLGVSLYFLS